MKAKELKTTFDQKKLRLASDLATFLRTKSSQDQPNYTMLLGAGASKSSGIRTASELVSEWRREIYTSLNPNSTEYSVEHAIDWLKKNESHWYEANNEYASLFEKKFDLPPQRRVFVEEEVEHAIPSIGYAYFSALIDNQFLNTVFTTNFDDLINEALFRFSKVRPITCAHDSSIGSIRITSKRPKVIKLHGDYLYDDIKCTQSETESLQKNMERKLRQFLREFGLIVIGYSGQDNSVMKVLHELIQEEEYLRYGIYWVFRETDEVSEQTLKLLEKDKVYYVISDGFDEIMAQLYKSTCGNKLPFSNSDFLSATSEVADSWIESNKESSTSCETIRSHLNELQKSKKKGAIARALSDGIEDNDTSLSNGSLNNDELLIILELGNLLESFQYDEVINSVEEHLTKSTNKSFKLRLLRFSTSAYQRTNNLKGVLKTCEDIIQLENSPRSHLTYARNLQDLDKKIESLENAISLDAYHWPSHHYKAEAIADAIQLGLLPNTQENRDLAKHTFETSLAMNPGISNPSWVSLFCFYNDNEIESSAKTQYLETIIAQIQQQDKYCPKVCKLIVNYCIKNKTEIFGDTTVFNFLEEACSKSFPKYHPSLLYYMLLVAEEFGSKDYIIKHEDDFDNTEKEYRSTYYYQAKAGIFLDIYRDIDKAILYLKSNLSEDQDGQLLYFLISYLLGADKTEEARRIFNENCAGLDIEKRVKIESTILTEEEKYREAIALFDHLSNTMGFEENYAEDISYIYLRSGNFLQAKDFASKVLNKHHFDQKLFPTLIINYEYAKQKLSNKSHSKSHRLSELANHCPKPHIRAIAMLLMGETGEAVDLLTEECEKDFSNYYQFRRWPIVQPVMARLNHELGLDKADLQSVS